MSKIEDIRTMTKGVGGMFREFSQSDREIKSARSITGLYTNDKANCKDVGNGLYVGGMCHIMSTFWIVGQASGVGPNKTGFIDWVSPNGINKGANMQAVSVLVAKTVMYKAKGGDSAAQGILNDPHFDDNFFALHGIKNKNESGAGFDGIASAIGKSRDRFFMLSYGYDGGGHACAAQSTAKGGHAYFDPNYGAALLTSRKMWEAWYDQYLTISGYRNRYTRRSWAGYKHKGAD